MIKVDRNSLIKLSKYNKLLLFFVAAFPIHLWSVISQLWQYGDGKDFFERGAYSLSFALFESIVVFLVLIFFSFFLPRKWGEKRILTILCIAYFVVAFWSMLGQIYFMLNLSEGTFLYRAFSYVGRHQLTFFISFILAILVSTIMPLWFIFRSEKFTNMIVSLIERISVLTVIYLILDFVGVLAVIAMSI